MKQLTYILASLLILSLASATTSMAQTQSKPVGFGAGFSYHQGFMLNATVGKWYGGITVKKLQTNWSRDFGITSVYNNKEMASFQVGHAIIGNLYGVAQITSIWNETYVGIGDYSYDVETTEGGDFGVGAQLMYLVPISGTHFALQIFGGYDTIQTYTAGASIMFSFRSF